MSNPTPQWRYKHDLRARTLWLDGLVLSRFINPPEHFPLYPLLVADAVYAAAWAALDFWEVDARHRSALHDQLEKTASFLHLLKPDRTRNETATLKRRLQKICGQGEARTEVWAYLLGHWLQTACDIAPSRTPTELTDLGWPLASFGLSFWSQDQVYYREQGQLHKLVCPFTSNDAFDVLGPFEKLVEPGHQPVGAKIFLASLSPTPGLRIPKIWKFEAMLGGVPGVLLTQNGHIHRQFAATELPEWFEAVEVTYDRTRTDLTELLVSFWSAFHDSGDLLFYSDTDQRKECLEAWSMFRRSQPSWAISETLQLHRGSWFDPAPSKKQKLALQERSFLLRSTDGIDFQQSHLATKLNAFVAGFSSDDDVVLLAARYALSAGLTTALRSARYFASLQCGGPPVR